MMIVQYEIKSLINNDEFECWKQLYKKYLTFYNTSLTEDQLANVWSWFFNQEMNIYCYAAKDKDGKWLGLIHFRKYLRPIKAGAGIFIDDLYVDDDYRGQHIGQQLIQSVKDYAVTQELPIIRWITAEDNQIARKLYDKISTKTHWVMYEIVP
jgi:ribosomal protein S18 acetylase RimI-like enzyme